MRNPNCELCSLSESSSTVCLWGNGSAASSGVMIIGDAPSATNINRGEYLTGGPGKILVSELERVGIKDFYATGVVKCQPLDGKKVEPSECKACAGYIQDEIKEQKPKYVLVMGATAAKSVVKAANLSSVAGKFIEKDGVIYVPCYSPAYVLRDPSKEPEFKRIIKRFGDLVKGVAETEWEEPRVRIIDRSNLDEFMQAFPHEPEFICDLETSGLDWYNPDSYINCVGVYLPKSQGCWVLPIRKAPTLPAEAQRKLLHWMSEQKVPVTNQNWKFDSLWLWLKMGVTFYNKDDTMLMHYNLDENTPHGLKENARLFLNAPDYDLTTAEKKGAVDAMKLFVYCGRDCYRTYRLAKLFRRMLMQDAETRNIYEHLTMPASRMYEVIEREGHHVNLERRAKAKAELEELLKITENRLNQMAGSVVNWNSPKQVGAILYGTLGLKPSVFTDSGAASTGEAALAELDGHPIVKLLTDYRSHEKMLSTYIDGWDPFMVGSSLFLGTKLHGTVTGRYSSRLHQVPRDGTIRNLIEAPEGWTFIQGDLSQAELRIIAIVSGDQELIKCYNDNIDVHWRTSMGLLSLGDNSNVELAKQTSQMYCLRSGLPSHGYSIAILHTLWEANQRREETEKSLEKARAFWFKTLEESGEDLSILRKQLPSLRSSSEILLSMWGRDSGEIKAFTLFDESGSNRIPVRPIEELLSLWSESTPEGSILRFLQSGCEERKGVQKEGSSRRDQNPWSREWRKSGRAFESFMEGGNFTFTSPEIHERFMRTLWIYSILSGPSPESGSNHEYRIQLPNAVSLLSSLGPSITKSVRKEWGEIRKQSKGINFGNVYGMGANKFTEYAKLKYEWEITIPEAQQIQSAFFSTYASLPLWHDRQRAMVKIDGFVRSLSGRKRRLPGIWSPDRGVKAEAERQAINSPVQGFIGDLKVMAMLDIFYNLQAPDNGAKLKVRGEVHDSILMWVRTEHLDEMLPKIKHCMERPEWLAKFGIELPVPIVADIEVGTWGAGKTWKGQKYNA